jgi:hypothetical protein
LRCFSNMPRLFFEPMDQGALPWRVTQWLAAATASTGRPLRPRRRIGAVGNQPQEACAEEPRDTGDRGCRRNAGDRAAGLRSGPHCQLAEEARAHGLVRRRALRVAPPRPGAAQGIGSQERPGRPGLTEAQVIALEKAKTEKTPEFLLLGCLATMSEWPICRLRPHHHWFVGYRRPGSALGGPFARGSCHRKMTGARELALMRPIE